MKKMNKKGFTLIELLAVIVILAIIMVIAVPQILDVITESRKSAWDSNVKLVDEAIELNTTLGNTEFADFSLDEKCVADTDDAKFVDSIAEIADISTKDTAVTCTKTVTTACTGKTYEVTVSPVDGGQFDTDGITAKTLCY